MAKNRNQKQQKQQKRRKRRNQAGLDLPPMPPLGAAPARPPTPYAPPSRVDLGRPGATVGDLGGEADTAFLNFLAQEDQPMYLGTQLNAGGQITGSGPALYESWLQNQFTSDAILDYNTARRNDPRLRFDQYVGNAYGGPEGLAAAARDQYNALTPFQRGQERNPFAAGVGRYAMFS